MDISIPFVFHMLASMTYSISIIKLIITIENDTHFSQNAVFTSDLILLPISAYQNNRQIGFFKFYYNGRIFDFDVILILSRIVMNQTPPKKSTYTT